MIIIKRACQIYNSLVSEKMNLLNKATVENITDWIDEAKSAGAVALIDKDINWTSFDVVAKLKALTKLKKIGHAGTLDPLASGLMILCFGKATKTISNYQELKKKYFAVIKLGATTKSYDKETGEENIRTIDEIGNNDIETVLYSFVGKSYQIPPLYSAKWINGVRAYKAARANQNITLNPVEIEIFNMKINKIEPPVVSFNVECSKGTYIRALANDIGQKLKCGAYLTDLRRTGIGDYNVIDALKIDEIINSIHGQKEKQNIN